MAGHRSRPYKSVQANMAWPDRVRDDLRAHALAMHQGEGILAGTGAYILLHKMDANAREAAMKEMLDYNATGVKKRVKKRKPR